MRDGCCPLGVLKITRASEMPGASEGLISTTFHVSSVSQPNIFLRNSLTVASLGSGAAEVVDALELVFAGAAADCWAVEYKLASARVRVSSTRVQRFMVPFVKQQLAASNQCSFFTLRWLQQLTAKC